MDLPTPQLEVDRVVRRQRAEPLGDAAELEGELRGIRASAMSAVTTPLLHGVGHVDLAVDDLLLDRVELATGTWRPPR